MSAQFLTGLDLNKNQLLHAAVQSASSSSGVPSPVAGQIYYDTGLNQIGVCTNATGPVWTYLSAGSAGTVTSVSVVTANGFAGTVATSTSTPAITLTTSVTGLLKGNGTAISAATSGTDYAPATTGTSILKASSGGFANAVAGTDYLAPAGNGSALTGITVSQVSGAAPLASPALTGTPTAPTPATSDNSTTIATTAFVQSVASALAQGLDAKPSVAAVATANITLSAPQTIDGVSVTAGSRVLAVGQSTASQNGIWVVASGAWTRPADFASASSQLGTFVFVEAGTANANSGWSLSGTTVITVDTTSQTWVQFSGAGEITAGTGLSKSGNTINISTVPVGNGGTGQTTAQAAINALLGGTMTAGLFARANGTNFVAAALQAADIATNAGATPAAPANSLKYAMVYSSGFTLGNGSLTTITVTHNLNNASPQVTVWNSSGVVFCDVASSSANAITLTFATAPASNAIACTVVG